MKQKLKIKHIKSRQPKKSDVNLATRSHSEKGYKRRKYIIIKEESI